MICEGTGEISLRTTDSSGNISTRQIQESFVLDKTQIEALDPTASQSQITRAYTDPGTGEWITKSGYGNKNIQNLTIAAIQVVIGAIPVHPVAKTIATIALEYFKADATHCYYYRVYSYMMSALHPTYLIIRDAEAITWYLDANYSHWLARDYEEWDGRW